MLELDGQTDAAALPDEVLQAAWSEHAAWFESRRRPLSPSGLRGQPIADVDSAELDPCSEEEIASLQRRFGSLLDRLGGALDDPAQAG